jgi:hypothetical protein
VDTGNWMPFRIVFAAVAITWFINFISQYLMEVIKKWITAGASYFTVAENAVVNATNVIMTASTEMVMEATLEMTTVMAMIMAMVTAMEAAMEAAAEVAAEVATGAAMEVATILVSNM